MILFPAIDLKDGECVRLVHGLMDQATVFNDDPAAQATLRAHLKGEISRHVGLLETQAAQSPAWLCGPAPSALDLYLACLLRWLQIYPAAEDNSWFNLADWPHLQAMATRLERCNSVRAAIHAEGLGETPFTAPRHATPPEGSAT